MDQRSAYRVLYTWIGQQLHHKYPGISVCHGIWWDDPAYNWNLTPTEYIQQALKGTARVVSDDTNCFNFVRATYPHLSSNVVYLPNYEDLGEVAARWPEPSLASCGRRDGRPWCASSTDSLIAGR